MKLQVRLHTFGFFVIVLCMVVTSQTYLSGDISKFKLDSLNNPFIVENDIEVPVEKKVVIGPGCVFLFKMYTGFNVKGSLTVEGTTQYPVVFTTINDTLYSTKAEQNADAFDWNGIVIDQRAGFVQLNNFRLCYSVYGIKSQKTDIVINRGVFKSNGQFNFTFFEKIMDIQDNIAYSFPEKSNETALESNRDGRTSLRITSNPVDAEVYIDKMPGKRISPDAKTPSTVSHLSKLAVKVTLFKKDYADTTLILNLSGGKINSIDVTLNKIRPENVEKQYQLLHKRAEVKIGKVCLFSSPIFIIGGAGLVYLSEKNRQKANDAQDYLDKTIIHSGVQFEAMKNQYSDETRKRNLKFYPGIALFGLAAIDLGFGLMFYF